MARYHIKLTNNDTGEVIIDIDTNCIIGAVLDRDEVFEVGYSNASPNEVINTLLCVQKCSEKISGDLKSHFKSAAKKDYFN